MKQYIGTKLIEAEPACKFGGKNTAGLIADAAHEPEGATTCYSGYRVRYPDGYESWSPKDVFEKAYLPLDANPNLKTDAPSISQQMVDDFIASHETMTLGGKCTVVRAMLRNGFAIVEISECVSAENYDEKMGEEICMEHIRNQVWKLLGFLLATAVGGVK